MSLRKRNGEAHQEEGSSQEITSPDPVEMVRQYEHDENLAKLLQAQFNCEITDGSASITVRNPNVSIDLSTSGSSMWVLPQSPHDDALHEDFSGGDAQHISDDEEDIEVDDEEEEENELDEDDLVNEDDEADEEDEIDEADEEDEIDEEDEEVDDDEEDEDEEGEDDEDLDERLDGDLADRSRLFPEEIERLPTHINATTSSSGAGDEASKMCQICQDSYAKGDELRVLPCFHKFHSGCIDPWLLNSTTCPVCRIKVDLSERLASKFQ